MIKTNRKPVEIFSLQRLVVVYIADFHGTCSVVQANYVIHALMNFGWPQDLIQADESC